MTISPNQLKCLLILAEIYNHDSNCYYMRHIVKQTGLEYRVVRIAVRALARKGLAAYQRGLFDEDGMAAGSGYYATRAGYELVKDDSEFKGDPDELTPL